MAQVSGIEVRFSGNTQPLEQAVSRAEGALNSFSKTADNVVPVNFGQKVQMASYQIQDFATQVASGTSATRAFAQQAPQLLSGFGTVGVILGTVAAIAVPLAGTFLATGDAAAKLGEAISTIGPYAAVATAALAGFYAPGLIAGLTTTTGLIGTGLVGAIKAVTAAMLANPLGLLVAGVAAAAVAIFAFRDDVKAAIGVDIPAIVKDAVNFVIRGFMNLKDVVSIAFQNLGSIVGAALVGVSNVALRAITGLINKVVAGINMAIDAVNSLSDYTGVTLSRFKELEAFQFENVFADGAAAAGTAIGKAMAENATRDYVGEMGKLAEGAMSAVGSLFSGGTAPDATKGTKGAKDAQTSANPSQEPGTYFTDRLKFIQEQFASEMELKQKQYEEDQLALQNAFNNKLVTEQEYYDLSRKLAEQYENDIRSVRAASWANDLGAAADFFGSMEGIAQMGGKKMLKVAKAFGAAQALVATFQAAAQAMADWSTFSPYQKLAAYAAIVAQGMAAVKAIKGVSEGGGGGSAGGRSAGRGAAISGGGGGGGAGGGGPTTTFQFTLMNDPMGFGEKFARQFIDQLNSTQRNGGQIRGVIA